MVALQFCCKGPFFIWLFVPVSEWFHTKCTPGFDIIFDVSIKIDIYFHTETSKSSKFVCFLFFFSLQSILGSANTMLSLCQKLINILMHAWWKREEWEEAKVAKTDKRRFTSSGLDVIWQSSILVNKWREDMIQRLGGEVKVINYLYLLNETTLILVSRSGRKVSWFIICL